VYLTDAGDKPVQGSNKADYRLHYAIGLFDLGMKETALTGTEQGEKASNFKSCREKDRAICCASRLKSQKSPYKRFLPCKLRRTGGPQQAG
jgi:hypothetical protein